MDGRVQLPVIRFLQKRFGAEHVDAITEPGPNAILAKGSDTPTIQSIERRLGISIEHHKSSGVAVIGHWNCAGNPCPRQQQEGHTREAVKHLRRKHPGVVVIGLWVDEAWKVSEIDMPG